MTSTFDKEYLNNRLAFITQYSSASQFVCKHTAIILNKLMREFNLNMNSIVFDRHGYSNLVFSITFRLNRSDLTILISDKGYYELRIYAFKSKKESLFKSYQYLPFELDKMIVNIRMYFNDYKLVTTDYFKEVENYKFFQENLRVFNTYRDIVQELENCSSLIGIKTVRYSVSSYVDSKDRSAFSSIKYPLAFKKNENLVIIGSEHVDGHRGLSITVMFLSLRFTHACPVVRTMTNIDYTNTKEIIDFINS